MAIRVTSEAIQVHGSSTDEYPVSRFYRGARYGTLGDAEGQEADERFRPGPWG